MTLLVQGSDDLKLYVTVRKNQMGRQGVPLRRYTEGCVRKFVYLSASQFVGK